MTRLCMRAAKVVTIFDARSARVVTRLSAAIQLSTAESISRTIMPTETSEIETLANREYKWGFITDIEADSAPLGLNEEIVRFISTKKGEPDWMLQWRLKAYRHWLTMEEPTLGRRCIIRRSTIRSTIYYSAPKPKLKSLDEVDPELLATYEKLGIPLHERARPGRAWRWMRSSTAFRSPPRSRKLAEKGIIFCSFGEAVREHPELVQEVHGLGRPLLRQLFRHAQLARSSPMARSCYIPKGVNCPMELSTYFRINAKNTGQFERTLIIADEGA